MTMRRCKKWKFIQSRFWIFNHINPVWFMIGLTNVVYTFLIVMLILGLSNVCTVYTYCCVYLLFDASGPIERRKWKKQTAASFLDTPSSYLDTHPSLHSFFLGEWGLVWHSKSIKTNYPKKNTLRNTVGKDLQQKNLLHWKWNYYYKCITSENIINVMKKYVLYSYLFLQNLQHINILNLLLHLLYFYKF